MEPFESEEERQEYIANYITFDRTHRGFARGEFIDLPHDSPPKEGGGEFTDLYGCSCSIQDSSLATDHAIWLGINDAEPKILVPGKSWQPLEVPEGTLFSTRMHLNREQAQALVTVLMRFIMTGTIMDESNEKTQETTEPEGNGSVGGCDDQS